MSMKPLTVLALVVCLLPLPALAALGGDISSINTDGAQLKSAVKTTQISNYSVNEMQGAGGTIVREYGSPAGTVFAVTWQGQFAPDLKQLLGTYFDQYAEGAKQQKVGHIGRHPLNLQLPGLVVQRNGYMRAEYGRAYVPQQIPAEVKLEDIK